MENKKINLNEPLHVTTVPLVIRTVVDGKIILTEVGPVEGKPHVEEYILFSALPSELQDKIRIAVQYISRGG